MVLHGLRQHKRGWLRIRSQPPLFRIVFESLLEHRWRGLAGVYLVLMGADVQGFGAAFGFGLFFFARGVGTGLGPIIARAFLPTRTGGLP